MFAQQRDKLRATSIDEAQKHEASSAAADARHSELTQELEQAKEAEFVGNRLYHKRQPLPELHSARS